MNDNIKIASDMILENTGKWIKDNPHAYQDDIYKIVTEVLEHMAIHNFVSVQPIPYTMHNVGQIFKLEIDKPLKNSNGSLSSVLKKWVVQTSDKLAFTVPNYKSGNSEELEIIISELRHSIESRVIDVLYETAAPPDKNNISSIHFSFLDSNDSANIIFEKLISEAKLIGARCRQGNANFAIVSPMALTALQCATIYGESVFVRSNIISESKSFIKMCGTITSDDGLKIDIYCNPYSSGERDGILLGYMGGQSSSPITYVPQLITILELDSSGSLNVSVNDGMHVGFSDDSLCTAVDYYSFIGITT